ncbi:MAG TPA: hypothetical protein VLZ83_13855 [Edaphocola sp.]|nr:hypothetical protein [Edaphocola sp.]
MKFAIKIEPTFTIIAPEVEVLNKEVGAALLVKVNEEIRNNPYPSIVVDLSMVSQLLNESITDILSIQEAIELSNGIIVFTCLQEFVLQKVKQERLHLSIHVATTIEDAQELIDKEKVSRSMLNEL